MSPSSPDDSPKVLGGHTKVRWWPLFLFALIALGVLVWIWGWYGPSRQHRILGTARVILGCLVAFLAWLLALSRLRWRVRLAGLGTVIAFIGGMAGLFRIRGVSGDLIPVLEWRWQDRSFQRPSDSLATNAPVLVVRDPAHDYPQFLGPARNGTVPEIPLDFDWSARPPTLLWRHEVGPAWSGFAVAGNQAVTQEQWGPDEVVVFYDLLNGGQRWSHRDPARYATTIAGEGPRATPTIVSNRVLTVGATGILNCLSLTDGSLVWTRNFVTENQAGAGDWGVSGSPLVSSNRVVVNPGGMDGRCTAAYDLVTGASLWTAGQDGASYCSPVLLTLANTPQVLMFNGRELTAHDPDTGVVWWTYPWPGGHPHIAVPLLLPGDRVLLSSGYGTGAAVLQIQKEAVWTGRLVWKSNRLKSKFANVLFRDGYIYGLDDGILVCLDAATGDLKWKDGRYGHGQMILTGANILVMAENGEVVVVRATPERLEEVTRFQALRGKTWNPPALAGEYLLVRNDKEAACYRLPLKK